MRKPSDRILSVQRSPLYTIMDAVKGLKDVIFLNIGEPDFPTPDHIVEAGKKALDEGYTKYRSAGDRGDNELRDALSEHLQDEIGVSYDPARELLVTAGSQAALYCSIMATVNPGDEVIIINPHYPPYLVDVRLAGGLPVTLDTDEKNGFTPEPEKIEEKVTERTKGIIVHTPNNPTGSVYSMEYLEALADVARRHDLIVYSDEVYNRITYNGAKHHSIASMPDMKERTVVINSSSKPYSMTGWRVGYLATNEDFVAQILKTHHSINICPNPMAQRAFLAALRGPQDCVTEFVREFDERRRYLVETLNSIRGISCRNPLGAFYVFANVKGLGQPSLKLAEFFAREARVVTSPGIGFGVEGYLRVSYAASLETLQEAIDRIKKVLPRLT